MNGHLVIVARDDGPTFDIRLTEIRRPTSELESALAPMHRAYRFCSVVGGDAEGIRYGQTETDREREVDGIC
jgi:hypothetical protein